MKIYYLIILGIFAALTGHAQVGQGKVPLEDFFRNTEFSGWRLSPDGETLLALGPWEGRRNLFSFELSTMQARRLTGFKENNVANAIWATNDRILYFMDRDGNESFGIFAIDKNGDKPRTLVPPLGARPGTFVVRYTTVLDVLESDESGILVINNDERIDYPDVYFMDIGSGGMRIHTRNPGNVTGWFTDQNSKVRAAVYSDRANKRGGILYRKDESSEWEDLGSFGEDAPGWRPVAFDFDKEVLYVRSNLKEDRSGLYLYDLKKRSFGAKLFSHDEVDVGSLVMSRHYRAPVGVSYNADKPSVKWFSEEYTQIQSLLDRTFPDTVNLLVSASHDETRMVVSSFSDRHPAFFHLLDFRDGTLELTPLSKSRPWIDPDQMAEMLPVDIKARDGKILPSYLTLPRNRKDGEPVPMIVNPHGGPWARDSWGFNPEVQFLANRGFAVLQVNFRSSTGFGREFERAGNKRWGVEMQYDIIDAVRWAIAEGYADKDRIAIYGASYGGYATMMQLVQYPEYYQRGINYVGPVHLPDLINHRRSVNQNEVYQYYQRTIGDPETEMELLLQHSPITHLDKLTVPVFIIHGTLDPRVPVEQAVMLRRQLERMGKPYEWLVKTNEGHGFSKEENNFEKYAAIEEFLKPLLQ